jgi:hypothetical protein
MTRKKRVYISKQVKYMHKHHKDIFRNVLRKISQKQLKGSTNVNHWKSSQDITKSEWKNKNKRWIILEEERQNIS